MRDIAGKVALVTGGGKGMGALWARKLAEGGARVAIWGTDAKGLRLTEQRLQHYGVVADVVDVADATAVRAGAQRLQQTLGAPVAILVNNAGIVQGGRLLDVDDAAHARVLDVNLKAMLWTMKAVLPGMLAANDGHIVNVASAAGLVGVPGMAAYVASKWGVIGLTESMRYEVQAAGKNGVKFTIFCPSFVDTGMFAGAKPPLLTRLMTPEQAVSDAYAAFRADETLVFSPRLVRVLPLGRGVLPTKTFDWLCSLLGITQSMRGWRGRRR